jgi:hypothetical protein
MSKQEFIVLDGRAQYDMDAAIVMEACGSQRPSNKYLRDAWGDQGAVLVRWFAPNEKGEFTESEIVAVIP